MTNKPHKFKNGYTRPFRANCKKCGLKKQDPIHDTNLYACNHCGFDEILRIDNRCNQCQTLIDWNDYTWNSKYHVALTVMSTLAFHPRWVFGSAWTQNVSSIDNLCAMTLRHGLN